MLKKVLTRFTNTTSIIIKGKNNIKQHEYVLYTTVKLPLFYKTSPFFIDPHFIYFLRSKCALNRHFFVEEAF